MPRMTCILYFVLILCCSLAGISHAAPSATNKFTIVRSEDPGTTQITLFLPYAFPSDLMGTTFGMGTVVKGYGQEQLLFGATVFGSTDAAAGTIIGMWDYRLPWLDTLYLSAMGSVGYYPRQRAYTALNRTGKDSEAGGNDSDPNDYMQHQGVDQWFDLKLEYVLPMGGLGQRRLPVYHLSDGILTSGATGRKGWNPWESGITTVVLKQYNRYQSYDTPGGIVSGTIHPIEIGIHYDNTDFPSNPSRGSAQYLALTRDFAWSNSDFTWTFLEFETSHYLDLGPSQTARQRVIALNGWTGDTLSYDTYPDSSGNIIRQNHAPFLAGSRLGGFWRMRGYDTNRFNDRSVVYACAEYRHTLRYNPIARIRWLDFLQMDWLQIVGFVEGGRVANQYNLSTLFSSWKTDIGLGLRAMVAGGIVRLDWARSSEGNHIWFMVGQPF